MTVSSYECLCRNHIVDSIEVIIHYREPLYLWLSLYYRRQWYITVESGLYMEESLRFSNELCVFRTFKRRDRQTNICVLNFVSSFCTDCRPWGENDVDPMHNPRAIGSKCQTYMNILMRQSKGLMQFFFLDRPSHISIFSINKMIILWYLFSVVCKLNRIFNVAEIWLVGKE